MKQYKVMLLVPHETTIEAEDLGKAHTEAVRLSKLNQKPEDEHKIKLLSCIEVKEETADFGPSPAA